MAAVAIGLVFSTVLAHSVASRVGSLVHAMRRVEQGDLSERVQPTGNDEIDILARQFNAMVNRLDQSHQTIRDLNANLESKVRRRTRQLSRNKRQAADVSAPAARARPPQDRVFLQRQPRAAHAADHDPVPGGPDDRRSTGTSCRPRPRTCSRSSGINGRRLLELINRLLRVLQAGGRATSPRARTAVDLNGLVNKLTSGRHPAGVAARRTGCVIQCDPAVPVLGADGDKIDTVLTNLLSNAIKFTPPAAWSGCETALLQGRRPSCP